MMEPKKRKFRVASGDFHIRIFFLILKPIRNDFSSVRPSQEPEPSAANQSSTQTTTSFTVQTLSLTIPRKDYRLSLKTLKY